MKKEKNVNYIKFPSTISKMGGSKIIRVPLAIHSMIEDFEGKKILVTIQES